MSIVCPICQKDDAIRKVSTVYSAGHSSGTFSGPAAGVATSGGDWALAGGYTSLSGSVSTQLANRLSPPAKPTGLSCFIWGIAIYPGLLFVLLLPFAIVGQTFGLFSSNPFPDFVYLIGTIIGFVSSITSVILYIRFLKKRHDVKLAREKYRYQVQMDIWTRLYYCFRDDIVFDPQSGEQFPSESLHAVLEDQYKQSLINATQ